MTPLCMRRGNRLNGAGHTGCQSWQWRPRSGAVTVGQRSSCGDTANLRTVALHLSWIRLRESGGHGQSYKRPGQEGHGSPRALDRSVHPAQGQASSVSATATCQGLSFINCFDRDHLDLIDDVIHENSHHHLNLLLRKQILSSRGSQPADLLFTPAPQPAPAQRHSARGIYICDRERCSSSGSQRGCLGGVD